MELEYTYWQGNGWLVGYLNNYPQYKTQGKNVAELEAMLLDVYENIQIEEQSKQCPPVKQGRITIPGRRCDHGGTLDFNHIRSTFRMRLAGSGSSVFRHHPQAENLSDTSICYSLPCL